MLIFLDIYDKCVKTMYLYYSKYHYGIKSCYIEKPTQNSKKFIHAT